MTILNQNRDIVDVPKELAERCLEYASMVRDHHHQMQRGDLAVSAEHANAGFWRLHEAAVCLALDLDPDTALLWDHTQPGDGYVDLNYDGKSIDVKGTSSIAATHLIWPKTQAFVKAADILVLTRPAKMKKQNPVQIVGFIMRKDFRRLFKRRDFTEGTAKTASVHQTELTPIIHLYWSGLRCHQCDRHATFSNGKIWSCLEHRPVKSVA